MPDYKMPDGTEVTFDLYKITQKEYRAFANGSMLETMDDEILARCSGIDAGKFAELPQPEFRKAVRSFFRKAQAPLAETDDPNP